MINLLSADLHNSAGVRRPGGGISADGKGSSAGDVARHVVLSLDGGESTLGGGDLGGIVGTAVADSRMGSIRVVALELLSSERLDVGVGGLGVSSTASSGLGVATDDLLGAQDEGGLENAHDIALELLGGREGPARSALFLVLDGGGVDTSPVNEVSSVDLGEANKDVLRLLNVGSASVEDAGELVLTASVSNWRVRVIMAT